MRYFAVALLVIAAWAGDFGAHMWLDANYANDWEEFGYVVTLWGVYMFWRFTHDDAPEREGWSIKFRDPKDRKDDR